LGLKLNPGSAFEPVYGWHMGHQNLADAEFGCFRYFKEVHKNIQLILIFPLTEVLSSSFCCPICRPVIKEFQNSIDIFWAVIPAILRRESMGSNTWMPD
jgi:hypothetical protein